MTTNVYTARTNESLAELLDKIAADVRAFTPEDREQLLTAAATRLRGGVIRRMFDDGDANVDDDPLQVFVEFRPGSGVMHVATRNRPWHTWSPPMTQVRNEDGAS